MSGATLRSMGTAGVRPTIVALFAVSLLTACGTGSATGGSTPEATSPSSLAPASSSAPTTVGLTTTCPEFQAALDAHVADAGNEDWAGLGTAVQSIADHADPADASLFSLVATASTRLATTTDFLNDQGVWLDVVDRVSRACKVAGAPLN